MEELKLIKADNGWIVEYPKNEIGFIRRELFEVKESFVDERKLECETWKKVLWHLSENIGVRWDKHESVNVKIEVVERVTEE